MYKTNLLYFKCTINNKLSKNKWNSTLNKAQLEFPIAKNHIYKTLIIQNENENKNNNGNIVKRRN